jgi:Type VI secretion, TssG
VHAERGSGSIRAVGAGRRGGRRGFRSPGAGAHPAGAAERLRQLTAFFSRDQIDFEVQLILKRVDVPECELEERVQLGWTTWVKNRPYFPRDPEDTILFLQ